MTFHRLFFAAVLGLAGTALVVVGLWTGFAALGTDDTNLGWLAFGLALPGLLFIVLGYRGINRELARDGASKPDPSS